MVLSTIDWIIVIAFLLLSLIIGLLNLKKLAKAQTNFSYPAEVCRGGY